MMTRAQKSIQARAAAYKKKGVVDKMAKRADELRKSMNEASIKARAE